MFKLEDRMDDTTIALGCCHQTPHGILLVTGPTGSGKSTTLYASLVRIAPTRSYASPSNPVEYHVEGVNQILVHRRVGSTSLRACGPSFGTTPTWS